jgi:threonine dehydrogenase-like Zn-dependent dehydrogenase
MKAARIVAPRTFEIVDTEEPTLNGAPAGMIKVRPVRAAICGSDLPLFSYDLAAGKGSRGSDLLGPLSELGRADPYPLRPGQSLHECVGEVVASTSTKFREGDFVLADPPAFDGAAEFFCTGEGDAVHVPRDGVPAEQIVIAQPLGTVIWACRKLGCLIDADTVVLGQGPMGLLISHMLSNLGARSIIGVDKLDYRLEISRRMRTTHRVNVDREDPEAAVREITGGKMADLVFEAVGHQTETIELCMNLVRRQGTVVAFGVPDVAVYENFPYARFYRKNLTLIGSVGPDVAPDYSLARDMIVQGRVDVSPIVTHVLPFQAVQRAFELFADRRDGAVKVVLDYDALTGESP